ncbi:uncharacterized protein TRIVIDRAFT_60433 [Trichoderma virens Gv29-8]|uniref:Uncharacterized protein n=1 Tax=Hypocrea virens (strain Gv29-8 / FGSC 10586) TaxID=413071 RepID=G9MRK7_HYPVG|nr:uncharacterized protein TRIVIDRAFT_60433 [Trichoderma virens Gv29-8]EHK22728.1 hypothetical protein TRIVIDRAFT_60433 [Trichoderma virens Gv29-8]UKZ47779.1 hypothetical protein TrVGV298_002008 [Trichoderma virens]
MSEQENRANGNTSQEQNPDAGTGLMIPPTHTDSALCGPAIRAAANKQTHYGWALENLPTMGRQSQRPAKEAQSPAQTAWTGAIAIGSWPTTGAAQALGSTQTGHASGPSHASMAP